MEGEEESQESIDMQFGSGNVGGKLRLYLPGDEQTY